MKQHLTVCLFYHSLVSDWNHGNAHFLRGVATELIARGHEVRIFEPLDGWSRANLLREAGPQALVKFQKAYPHLSSRFYRLEEFDLDEALEGADLVLVHEWNDPDLVAKIGKHSLQSDYHLLFHDTHHRMATDRKAMEKFDLRYFDGILAYGEALREVYAKCGWGRNSWTWHEAADNRVFRPLEPNGPLRDLIWIGNWGDGERTRELHEFFIQPATDLGLLTTAHGVRYPKDAIRTLNRAGIDYQGWIPNFSVPQVYSRHRVAVHIPRRPYTRILPGIPTIRPFEALACGIPLICSPWHDTEGLFRPGSDYLVARDTEEMKKHLRDVLSDDALAEELSVSGMSTILQYHTCAHRVDELLEILRQLEGTRKTPRMEELALK